MSGMAAGILCSCLLQFISSSHSHSPFKKNMRRSCGFTLNIVPSSLLIFFTGSSLIFHYNWMHDTGDSTSEEQSKAFLSSATHGPPAAPFSARSSLGAEGKTRFPGFALLWDTVGARFCRILLSVLISFLSPPVKFGSFQALR